jgi:hypothetical protein
MLGDVRAEAWEAMEALAARAAKRAANQDDSMVRSGPANASPRYCVWSSAWSYHPTHVSRLLQALRWSPHKPRRRARQCDEAAIAQWRKETWPAIKRGRTPKGKPSFLQTNGDSIPCRASCARMRR